MSAVPSPQSSGIPPISCLPPELLIDIFDHCSDEPSEQLTPVVLGQVCRYWKDVSNLSPRSWQHLYLYESNGTTKSHAQALHWIYKSNPLPFDVRVEATTADMILPLLSPILSHMQRIQRCVIVGRHEEKVDFLEYPFDRTRGCLVDELHILIKGVSALDALGFTADSDASNDRSSSNIFRVHSPRDKPPELALHFSVYALPLESIMKPIPVRYLCITEFSIDVDTDIARLLNFLRCTPYIETFRFSGWPQEGDPIQSGTLRPVKLARLNTLLIRSTVSVRAILSHIDAPALENLFLEHTNVDFELRTEPYVAEQNPPDEGESDDEAHDFSQSPWSDHATGMGIRTLLKRSRPPLQVLRMDYADMRTKDFKWCFDHLEHLREFRIVGSDMSDRVVSMLAPYRKRWLAFGIANPRQMEDPQGSWAVRMPALTKLAILYCQRVSGDALIQALQDRVLFTDVAAEEGRGETLDDIIVLGCSEVLFQHNQMLSNILGPRVSAA